MTWRSLRSLAAGVLVVGSFLVSTIALASVITSATLTLSSHEVSTAANHTVEFVTPTGVDASTDTIILEYASGFSLGLIDEGDIDLGVDDDSACDGTFTDKTLAASAGAGTWGVAVAGQTVTFTAPTDAALGEITAGRCVQIQIGTNADSGSNQIVNPASTGSYEVDVDGTFGDHGMYAVAIAAADSVLVSGTVGSSGGGSTPPPSPTPDTAAPVVANVVVSSITTNSAVISWTTDEPAERTLFIGEDTSYSTGNYRNTSFRTEHTQTVSGLSEGTTYLFELLVADNIGNTASYDGYSFTTLDVTPPVISAVTVTNVTETSATISWETNEPADSAILDGASTLASDSTLDTVHALNVTGLTPGTGYELTIESSDASGNLITTTVKIETLADLPPANVSGLTATPGNGDVALSWSLPAESDLATVVIYASTSGVPAGLPSEQIFDGLATAYLHSGLTNGTTYYYLVVVYDIAKNSSSGASVSATPVAPTTDPDDDGDSTPDDTGDDADDADDAGDDDATDADDDTADDDATDDAGDDGTDTDTDTDGTGDDAGADDGDTGTDTDTDTGDGTDTGDAGDGADTGTDDGTPDTGDDTDGEVTLPETTVPEAERLPRSRVSFLVARDTIQLQPSRNGRVRVLGGRPLTVVLNVENVPQEIVSVELLVGSASYRMMPTSVVTTSGDALTAVIDSATYQGTVRTPGRSSELGIVITYLSGEQQSIPYELQVVGSGLVQSSDAEAPLDQARVTLQARTSGWQPWNVGMTGQANPQQTTGAFAWYVPNGTYRVTATASGFAALTGSAIRVQDNIVNPTVTLVPILAPFDEVLEEEIAKGTAPVVALARVVGRRAVQSIRVVRQDPGVRQAASVAAPVTAAVALSTAATLATSFNLLPLLQYFFTAPLLLLRRRRRKQWGVVYDSLRKVPIDLAIVRLKDAATGRILKSQVTDRLGRYLFIVEPGTYQLVVQKVGYQFPTSVLKDRKRDGDYLDLYHGEVITVDKRDVAITANVPLDVTEAQAQGAPKTAGRRRWMRRVQYGLSAIGVIVALLVTVIQPTIWTITVAVLQLIVFILFLRLAIPAKPKGWGIIYDEKTRRPLAKAVVRIFDPTFNKLLETQVTDARGRYAFLVGPSEYYATIEREGYHPIEVRPIDRTDVNGASYVSMNISLEKTASKR